MGQMKAGKTDQTLKKKSGKKPPKHCTPTQRQSTTGSTSGIIKAGKRTHYKMTSIYLYKGLKKKRRKWKHQNIHLHGRSKQQR